MRLTFFLLVFSALTQSAFADSCRPAGPDMLNCGGVHVVRLQGTPLERARRMGELVRSNALSPDVLQYFGNKVTDLLGAETGWLARPLTLAYHQLVRLFHSSAPAGIAEEIDAMAAGLHVDPIILRRGLSLPDTGVLLEGLGSTFPFLPSGGCTSIATPLAGGGFAYGRNLDFAGVGAWDRHPMIAVIEPPAGSAELRHLVVGADGLPFAGITGVNEAGITFAVHQNYSRDISVTGVPMVLIGELVLRSAKTLEEAVEILRKNRPANLWTFVLTDLSHGTAIAVESSSRVFLTRASLGKAFAQTNHLMHEESRQSENASYAILANSQFRYDLALSQVATPPQTVAALAKLLAYQEDPLGQLSGYHDVLKSETIQTVLFESLNGDIRLSLSAEAAPSAAGRYAQFSLADLFTTPKWQPRDYVGTSPEKRQRQLTIAAAYSRYFDEQKFAEAAALLASQHTLDAALFRCVAMAAQARYEDSLRLAEEALQDPRFTSEPAYMRDSLVRVKLVSLFRLGRHEEARTLAQIMIERGSKQLDGLELARKILNRESIPSWRLALGFDFFSGDLSGRQN